MKPSALLLIECGTIGAVFAGAAYTRTIGKKDDFPIPISNCGAPNTASAYAMNFTVVPPGPLAYLSTWATGQLQPYVSTLNSADGAVLANAAIVPAEAERATSGDSV